MLNQAYSARCLPLNQALRGLPVRISPGQTVVTNAVLSQLGAQAFGKTDQRELAGAVRQQVRHADLAADGRDVDDAPLAASPRISGSTASVV